MPIPPITRATIIPGKEGSIEQPSADNKNNSAASINGFFLPRRSLSSPEMATPMIHPTNAEETNQPSSPAEKENCVFNKGSTPDTTAISNPNNNPPSDATSVIKKRQAPLLLVTIAGAFLMLNYFFDLLEPAGVD